MKVMQLRLDDSTYAEVEQRAYRERKSLTAVVKEALADHLKSPDYRAAANGRLSIADPKRPRRWGRSLSA